MIVASWNIRGFNMPLKHQGVQYFLRKRSIDVLAILETKLTALLVENILKRKFGDWKFTHNLSSHSAGRIVILWRPQKVTLNVLQSSAQIIHCNLLDKNSGKNVCMSFVYGLHSITARRALWLNLLSIGANMNSPWLVFGDFNSILCTADRVNGTAVSTYEIRDFQDCCLEFGLSNLNSHGSYFSWTNGRVWSKLDRVLCNNLWSNDFQRSSYEVPGFESILDHSPIIVSSDSHLVRGNVSFKFHNSVTDLPSFLPTVAEGWQMQVSGNKMFIICKKLKGLKVPLKQLYIKNFSKISGRIEMAEIEYNNVLLSLQSNPKEAFLLGLADRTRRDIISLRKAEVCHISQLMKSKFLIDADKCSKFFHSYINSNRHHKFIVAIHSIDGNSLTSQHDIANAFVSHFSDLLGVEKHVAPTSNIISSNGPKVPPHFFDMLLGPISKEDVWKIVAAFDDNRSPGPDGFNAKFFKASWNILGDDIYAAVLEFFCIR
ncbi:uncharacterized protein LOC133317554 [Gastrolobium bilobum]|uniref:uncharacterized protein LOC133317554 n=1 Tax=Gastrolobium bilobum TaxID=150636 RepID=UPI002AAFA7FD|nr:uncharacterized protein LOC133317554 [Gastrolobium bilobum]